MDKLSKINKMKFINHRGYCGVAPENTISAFKLSKEKGFDTVECDIVFTKDNVAVLSHDLTIDRTCASGQKGNICDLTYEDIKDLDFSYNKTDYKGEKIPTLKQFLLFCKELELYAYLDIRAETTIEQAKSLVDLVNDCEMNGNVSYISFNIDILKAIKEKDELARLGYVRGVASEELVNKLLPLKTDRNNVFMSCWYDYMVDEQRKNTEKDLKNCIERCKGYNIPLELWTVNDVNLIADLDPYISGITSDFLSKKDIIDYVSNKK